MSYTDDFRHLEIKLEDIKAATNDFSDQPIGIGGFGAVYKGELLLPEGRRMVALKRLNRKHGQGDVEFWKEIMMLTELKHENLASLLCFCREGNERILAYEYVSRGSLDQYLDKASLTWIQRLNICLGAARAIAYLHDPKKTQQRVLHRDIKSSNILLDDNWTAKLSDFGLAKLGPANQPRTYLVSNIVGTPGYCDPEYFATGLLSKECDVYSFGVVLFEVMCGRLCCEYDKGRLVCILVHTWKNRCNEDKVYDVVFPDLMQQINEDSLSTFAAIAKRCLDRDHKKRPSIVEIVKDLEIALNHQQSSKLRIANAFKTPTPYNSEQHIANAVKMRQTRIMLKDFYKLKIRLEDIRLATNDFSEGSLIGCGEFGNVYKGVLAPPGGQISTVAIKKLDYRTSERIDDFWIEIAMLSNYKHENLVSLLGFCDEHDEIILVYNYVSRGSLLSNLSQPDLTWSQRLKIGIEVARAVNYLHNPLSTHMTVVHNRIKSSNILLDEDWTTKVSDFGQTKIYHVTHMTARRLMSNVAYCDPLYMETGVLTKESDVYSFGVVLFEILCGRLCTDHIEGRVKLLVPEWKRCFDEKRLDRIIFPELKERTNPSSLNTFSSIAYQCLMRDQIQRPTMAKVMEELEIALQLQEDFEETLLIRSLAIPPISDTSRDQLWIRFPKGVIVGDGNTWLSKLEDGRVCEVICATKCIYADSLVHDNTQNSRFTSIIRGGMHNGFTVRVRTQFLSRKAKYCVSLVFKHNGKDRGTHIPFKFKLGEERSYFDSCMTHVRDDGWLMIELCQFTSNKREHDLEIQFLPLFTLTSSSIEYFVEGVVFHPVQYVC